MRFKKIMDKKARPKCTLCIRPRLEKYTDKLKVNGLKIIYHTNSKHTRAGMAKLMTDKTDFLIKSNNRDKEGHF